MKKGWIIAIAVVVLVLIIVGGTISTYNSIRSSQETIAAAYSNINVQLKRRNDLIPSLVNTVKGYTSHEKETIDSVTTARAKLAGAQTPAEAASADTELSGALSRLLVVVENYPNLKADANFRQLTDELTGTENRISVARQDYNDAAKSYNSRIKTFPGNMFARMFGFEKSPYFEGSEADQQAPVVEF